MRKIFLFISVLFSLSSVVPLSSVAQVANPFYLVAKKNVNGSTSIRLSWKADVRDLTVRNYVALEGSSTFAGIGPAGGFDSTIIGRTMKYLDDQQPGAMTWYTYAASGYSARRFIEEGAFVDPVRNINYAIRYAYLNNTIKEFPKLFFFQDANNWVADGVSTAQNLANIHSILTKVVQFGGIAILADVQPRETYNTTQRQLIEDLHNALRARYSNHQFPNIWFAGRWYDSVVVQPAKTIRTDFSAGDGIHLNNEAHRRFFVDHLKPVIDSIYAASTTIARHEIQSADTEAGPWTFYRNLHKDTGYINLSITNRTKYYRMKVVYNDSSSSAWSNIAMPVDKPLMPYEFYDWDGISRDRMGSGFHHLDWFDGFATHDPKYNGKSNLDTVGGSTRPFPTRPYHYPQGLSDPNGRGLYRGGDSSIGGGRGWRMLFDLSGDKDQFKLHKFRITGVYGLQQGGDFIDTLELYNGDIFFKTPYDQVDKLMSRPDSLLTPFYRLAQGHAIGYDNEWSGGPTGSGELNDSMRYVFVRIVRKNRGSYWTYPTFGEIVFYGEQLYSSDTIQKKQWKYTGPLPKRKTFGQMAGVNNIGVLLNQFHDGSVREYMATINFDDETTAYPSNQINANPFSFSSSYWNTNWGNSARAQGVNRWETIRAGSKRLEAQGWGLGAKSIPVTEGGMEPEWLSSYDRFADFFRHYAALFGRNSAHTDGEFRFKNKSQLPGYGLDYFREVEPGNEDETRGHTYLSIVAKDVRVKAAMKLGDSLMKLIQPASVYNDTGMLKSVILFSRLLTPDHSVIYDEFNGHEYPRQYPDPRVTKHDPTYEEQVGTKGASWEWSGLGEDIDATENVLYRELNGDTTKRFRLTEYGYDNYATPSSTVGELTYGNPWGALWSISVVPKVAGRDSLQGKGMLLARGEMRMAFTRMSQFNEYMIGNVDFNPDNNYPGLFARSGRGAASIPGGPTGSNIEIPTKYAHYWSRASMYERIKNYVADTILAYDSIGKCLVKFRHYSNPDSALYVIWKGSWNGTTLSSQSISVGNVTGNATKYNLSFTSPVGASTLQAVASNQIFIPTVTEEPVFYFVEESSSAPAPAYYFLKKKGVKVGFKQAN